jgi:spore maturation protein CgeB
MMNKIDVLMAPFSQHNVLKHFTRKLYEALKRTKISCRLLSAAEWKPLAVSDPPDLTIAFNGGPADLNHIMWCDKYRIPHVSCIVDSLAYSFLDLGNKYLIMACDDRYSCDFLKSINFQRTLFFPHAVERDLEPGAESERIYDVVMLGEIAMDPLTRIESWKAKYTPRICLAMESAITITFSDPETSYMEAFKTLNNTLSENISIDELTGILVELEHYIKERDKIELIQSIKDAKLHIFGNSNSLFRKILGNQSNIIFHEAVPYEQALEIMKRSKILLSSNTKNKNGAHERIFTGLACGALVITHDNKFLRETFVDDQTILFYQNTQMDRINDRMNKILANSSVRKQMMERGRQVVMQHHTWDHRVATLLHDLPHLKAMTNKD